MKRPLHLATLLLFSALSICAYGKNAAFNLQEAIDDASKGDTIVIPKGTYTQPIVIDKKLILDGKNAILEIHSDLPAIKIDTSKLVTLKNMDIRYQSETPAPQESDDIAAIYCEGGDLLIENSSAKWTGEKRGAKYTFAVFSTDQSTLQINGSRFDGFGILIDEKSEGCVEDCLILNSIEPGVSVRKDSTGEVRRNIIANSKLSGVSVHRSEAVIESNLIISKSKDNTGIAAGDKPTTICNNLIAGSGKFGIQAKKGDAEIANNVILCSGEAGVRISTEASFDIEKNVIVDNKVGFLQYIPKGSSKKGTIKIKGKNLVFGNKTQSKGVKLPSKTIEMDPEFTDADAGLFSLESKEAEGMGLTDPEIIQTLWKKWKAETNP